MIAKKYKVYEAAKDFACGGKEMTSKDIASFIEDVGTPKKYSTVLSDLELNILFDRISLKYAPDNFIAFFAPAMKRDDEQAAAEAKREAKEAGPAAAAARGPEEVRQPEAKQPEAQKPAAQQPEAQKPAAQQPAAQRPEAPKPAAQQPAARRPDTQKAPAKPAPQQAAKPAEPPVRIPPRQPKPRKERVIQPPQERVLRTVDTRSGYVDTDRYSGRYEQTGSSVYSSRKYEPRKVKINQKSKQQGKPSYARRETEAERMRRIQLEKARKQQLKVEIPDEIAVGELAVRLKKNVAEVIKKLISMGQMSSASDVIDFDTAALVAMEFNAKVEREVSVSIEERIMDTSEDSASDLVARSPVVCVMGHVDHGKTSLLDAIRKTHVTAGEAGGITQHIGAYRVKIKGKEITFLDTPGHAAFTAMRARGAQLTDIAIIVVAADDGIMPQTIEAINHAKAAGVSIIVAINKMDKPHADPERVKQQLTEYELVPEEWGGDVSCVPVSAVTGKGIDDLLETIILVADIQELKANPNRAARGAVVEARIDKGKGPIATLLVQNGTLHSGDVIVAGDTVGRVRTMTDDRGRLRKKAGPSEPVEITGLDEVPNAGDSFDTVSDERLARELVKQRKAKDKEAKFREFRKVTLENFSSTLKENEIKELPIIIKADVRGSVEALTQSLVKLSNDEVRLKVIHGAVGAVNESDVMLAQASGAIIVGFNVRPDQTSAANAENFGVDIRLYRVIYDCINEIGDAMKGMLAPKFREVLYGSAEVRQVYRISGVGTVAGCYVRSGKIVRNAMARVVRDGAVIADDKLSSLRRFKDDVKEVAEGFECGLSLEKYSDIKENDVLEFYTNEEYRD